MVRNKKCLVLLMALVLICYVSGPRAFSDDSKWERAFEVTSGNILCMERIDGTDTLYVGANNGLYKTKNMGKEWKKVDLPGNTFRVEDIAIAGGDVFLATRNGLYIGKGGTTWEWIPGKKDVTGVFAYIDKKNFFKINSI